MYLREIGLVEMTGSGVKVSDYVQVHGQLDAICKTGWCLT